MKNTKRRRVFHSALFCLLPMICVQLVYADKGSALQYITASTTATLPAKTIKLTADIPLAVTSTVKNVTLASLQHDFDVFSWQSFIALNWPSGINGSADTSAIIGQQQGASTVWQNWKQSRSIFLPGGKKPTAWHQPNVLPTVCQHIDSSKVPPGTMHLTQVGKTPNVLDESGEPFRTGPLIDQNGHYTRYEILTNEPMFDYIINNKLYSKQGQQDFGQNADFPVSQKSKSQTGAIMVKAAWVKMGEKFDAKKFHTSTALVYNNPAENQGTKGSCSLETVGLVGLHIAHKTKSEPQWVWSTFEHIDNAPTTGELIKKTQYNYFDITCTDCKVNQPPDRPWNPAIPFTKPSQVERVIPITEDAKLLNRRYQAALAKAVPGSVWVNYQLISTQWPTAATNPTDPTGIPAPSYLANTTLETYIQGQVRQTSSSCISCHNNATTTDGMFSDFTYLLQRAN